MNELLSILIPALTTVLGSVVGFFAGRRQKDNDFIGEQQKAINILIENNNLIMAKYTSSQADVLALREENIKLKTDLKVAERKITNLQTENATIKRKLDEFEKQLDFISQGNKQMR